MLLSLRLALLLLLLSPLYATAQKEWHVWYFGSFAGVDFTGGSPVALLDGRMEAFEGCASVSDRAGRLLFYTDGMSVWNRDHTLMPGGFLLHGDTSSTQSAVIVPQPGNNTVYYIVTAGRAEIVPTFGLQYSIVDMNAPSGAGLGDVTTKNVVLLPTAAEKITAVRHRNGHDVWIITHELGSNRFYTYRLTALGIDPVPVVSSVGTIYPQGIGYLKASQDGSRLAAAMDFHMFEVYDFNTASGRVSNPRPIRTSIPHLCYGVEFSPNGRLLYGSKAFTSDSRFFETSIMQFDLEAGSALAIEQSVVTIATIPLPSTAIASAGALQLGPDGRIYAAIAGTPFLGVITQPNERGTACGYSPNGVDLGGRLALYGLPNFHPAFATHEIVYTGSCFGEATSFSIASDVPAVDSVQWEFGDPATSGDTSTSQTPSYTYPTPGTYTVVLTVYRNGTAESLTREVLIPPLPEVELGADTVLCSNSLLTLSAENPALVSYLWSTGATSASITVATPGSYWVHVFDGLCHAADTINVAFRLPQIRVAPDGAVCRGSTYQLSASSTESLSYRWEPVDDLNNPLVPSPVARPTTTTTYTVTATDVRGCTTTATVTVRVDPPFAVSLGADRTICRGESAVLSAGTTGTTYQWSTGETTPTITVTEAGLYTVTVSQGSCSAVDDVQVHVADIRVAVTGDQEICTGGTVQLWATGATTYTWSPAEGLSTTTGATPTATPTQTTTYRVIGTSDAGCRDTAFVTIRLQQSLHIDIGPDTTLCAGAALVLHSPIAGARYLWSTGDTTSSITVLTPGVYTLTVTSGSCTASDELRVLFSTPAVQTNGPAAPLCPGDTAQLTAEGGSVYRWEPAESLSDPTAAAPLAFPDTTTTYTVTATDAHGCTTVASVVVQVTQRLPFRLSLPTTGGMVGTTGVELPVTIETDPAYLPFDLDDPVVEIRMHASAFRPERVSQGTMQTSRAAEELVVVLRPGPTTITEPRQVLTVLEGTLLLPDSTVVPLRFGALWHNRCLDIRTTDGSLTFDGCFIEGSRVRVFTPPSLVVAPNPATDAAVLHLRNVGRGAASVVLTSLEGRTLARHTIAIDGAAAEVALPTDGLPGGLYRVVLTTHSGTWTALLRILR